MKKSHTVRFKTARKILFGSLYWLPRTVEKTRLSRAEARLLVRTILMNGYNLDGRFIPVDQILEVEITHKVL